MASEEKITLTRSELEALLLKAKTEDVVHRFIVTENSHMAIRSGSGMPRVLSYSQWEYLATDEGREAMAKFFEANKEKLAKHFQKADYNGRSSWGRR